MKLAAFLFSILMCATAAQAAALPRLAPNKEGDAATCFKREYTEDHMRSNPGQLLEQIFVKVGWKSVSYEDGSKFAWMPAEVVGVSRGNYYGNTAGCQIAKDGSVNCQIECDGGSFSLRHSPRYAGKVNFLVTKDYYFPLFKNRMNNDMEEELEHISLQDEANRIYRLSPADVSECNGAINRITEQADGGC